MAFLVFFAKYSCKRYAYLELIEVRAYQQCEALSILGIHRSAIELLMTSEEGKAYWELIEVRSHQQCVKLSRN